MSVEQTQENGQVPSAGSGSLVRRARVKLPPQWEKCSVPVKGVRKWRCLWTHCWVTERDDDDVFLHVGLRGQALKIERRLNTVQQAIDKIHAASQRTSSSPNVKSEPRR